MATTPLFIADQARIQFLVGKWQPAGKGQGGWKTYYVDPSNGDEWVMYPLWDSHGQGPNCLRRRREPTLPEVLASIAAAESDSAAAAGALYLRTANLRKATEHLLGRTVGRDSSIFGT